MISRLKTFVANGGTLVMTYISGLVNEHDLVVFKSLVTDLITGKEITGELTLEKK